MPQLGQYQSSNGTRSSGTSYTRGSLQPGTLTSRLPALPHKAATDLGYGQCTPDASAATRDDQGLADCRHVGRTGPDQPATSQPVRGGGEQACPGTQVALAQ